MCGVWVFLGALRLKFDPDQARQNVGPDLDPNFFDALMVFLKEFFKKVDFEKKQLSNDKKA